jgi:hypothetical protein
MKARLDFPEICLRVSLPCECAGLVSIGRTARGGNVASR